MLKESEFVKLRIVVPREKADDIRQVLGEAGAGVQDKYQHCSFSYPVVGRFQPMPGAKPAIGEVGKMEEVVEEVIEVLCHQEKISEVVKAVKKVHPYESPAIDIISRLDV